VKEQVEKTMNPKERILKLLEDGKITADEAAKLLEALKHSYASNAHAHPHCGPMFIKHSFGRHHFDTCCHPPHKKVIVKMRGECCEDPEDIELMTFGCYG